MSEGTGMDEQLREAVEAQARAHAAGDAARFASYMTESALLELGRDLAAARGIRVRRFRILDITTSDGAATSEVRFEGSGSYALIERWERGEAGWRAASARCPAESIRRPWWRRLPFFGRAPEIPERQELT